MKFNSLQSKISDVAVRMPNKTAIEYGEENISYLELEEQSNRLANLMDRKIEGDKRVFILMDRCSNLIKSILAILKIEGIFIPISPDLPIDRYRYIMDEVETDWIITEHKWLGKLNHIMKMREKTINVILMNDEYKDYSEYENLNICELNKNLSSSYTVSSEIKNKNCYIYFTSGSTGRPKGILGRHKSLVHFIEWEIKEFEINEEFRVSQLTLPTFDVFLRDIFVPLCSGGTICIPDREEIILDSKKLIRWIDTEEITFMHMVPSIFKGIVKNIENSSCFDKLRYILLAGEMVRGHDVKNFFQIFGKRVQLVNLYGPTETTLAKLFYRIGENDTYRTNIPVGKPMNSTQVMILDNNLDLCKEDVIGEIYIRTPYITSGYCKKELNKGVFIKNPFNNNPRDIIYKTGDLGMILPDGNIELIGRVDDQVKIRGIRIEPTEIENRLLKYKEIHDAVVLAKEDKEGHKNLWGYVVGSRELTVKEIREHLSKELPDYMIPTYFVQLKKIPLNSNGKVDKKELKKLIANMKNGVEYEAPRNEIEAKLVEIWTEILKAEDIGINNNFFELGGHSLKATALTAKIHKELNVTVPLKEVFTSPTIKELSEYIRGLEKNIYSSIEAVEKREHYPLSSAQRRLYTLQQFELEGTSYNMPRVMVLEGMLNRDKLEEAFSKLIKRHESLRTSFEVIDNESVQRVHERVEFKIDYLEAIEKDVEEIIKTYIRAFDLRKAPLLRVGLIKLAEEKHILVFDMHHIISDGVSMGVLIKEFTKLYEGTEISELRIQYKDYAMWQRDILVKDRLREQEKYWLESFKGEIPVLNMPTDYPRLSIKDFEGESIDFKINKEITKEIKKIAKETGASLYMILLAGYNILLSKYSGQEDIVVGSPIAGRSHADLENIIGMFVNTLAMRNFPKGNKTFREFLEEVKKTSLQAYENQDYQFEELVEKLDIRRNMSRNPLFDAMLVLQNMDMESLKLEELSIKPYEYENRTAKFDISLYAAEVEEEIEINIEYRTKLFKRETMERLRGHLIKIFKEITANPEIKLSEIDMMTEAEKQQILIDFNNTEGEYPRDKTIQELFEEQVEKTPDNTAVVFEEEKLSYRELNEEANRFHWLLKEKGVKKGDVVGIMLSGSIELLISIIGILKAGGVVLYIDPGYPEERKRLLIEDSETKLVLKAKDYALDPKEGCSVFDFSYEALSKYDKNNPKILYSVDNLAYLIYTSGSTGKPKGVMLKHSGINNHIFAKIQELQITAKDKLYSNLSNNSVASIWQTWTPLFLGAELIIYPERIIYHSYDLFKRVQEDDISILEIIASQLNQYLNLIDEGNRSLELQKLRLLVLTGERVDAELVNKFYNRYKIPLVNAYGQSECSDDTLHYKIPYDINTGTVPIGVPTLNTKIYIINRDNKLQPVGVPGELCVSGAGVGKGYLNRPELTKEKFVDNPFISGERMYRTGDLAKWLVDGNIEFLGRVDNQVKIRGYRIELGEIESALLKHEVVKEAVVLAREDMEGNKDLCGYIVGDKEIPIKFLKGHLSRELPGYMIPAYFVQLEEMPLIENGKIDRKALLKLDVNVNTGIEYEAPRNKIEAKLVDIWKEVFKADRIGINDNFFELGGHSLRATGLTAKIHRELKVEIPLREIFERPTIKELSEYISDLEESIYSSIEAVEEREYYPPSSAQRRIYTLQQFELDGIGYNMSGAITLQGKLDKNRLEEAFNELIKRHESLRTSFEIVNDELVQIIHDDIEFKIESIEGEEEEVEEIVKGLIKPFDLRKVPLLRVGLIKLEEERHILIFDMHHIISDGTSMGILIKEFTELYEGRKIPELRIQYKDYSVWQREILNKDILKQQEKYWLERFKGEIPVLNMPTDYPRPSIKDFEGESIGFKINKEITKEIKRIAKETGTSLYMVLLAGYNILLSKYSGQEDIVVGSPIAGRPHADIENIIGMFVNTLAMRNFPKGNKTLMEFLEEVKKTSLQAYENQDYQFEELVEKLDVTRDMSRNPLFDTMLVLQNMEMGNLKLEDLSIKSYQYENRTAKFDISLYAVEAEEEIKINIEYRSKLFRRETMERFGKHLIKIFKEITTNLETKLKEIEILTEEEKQQILIDFNNTEVEYPRDKTIHQLFEDQVEKTPENTALIFRDEKLTYRELNEKANSLARILREKGIKADSLVGIMTERSIDMMIGILGILKAGGAYMPIDPEYPEDRISYILEDSNAEILLVKGKLKEGLKFTGRIIDLEERAVYVGDGSNLEIINRPRDLAYVIYTSGSTGKPKGVMVEHINISNFIKGITEKIEFVEAKTILALTTICFDIFALETILPLTKGVKVIIASEDEQKDPQLMKQVITNNDVDMLQITPSRLKLLIEEEDNLLCLNKLKELMVGGEAFPHETFYRIKDRVKAKIYNLYGPTETTVWSTLKDLTNEKEINIGKPISNTKIYIVDENSNLQPIGVPGELCIGGAGVTRGYLNRVELTKERFVDNPFISGEIMYRTGDLARWLPDGNIEFLGRTDNQVKVRGYRIELGEIESSLLKHKGVKEAVVLAREDKEGNRDLCGYVVGDEEVIPGELRRHLALSLPYYMIPTYFMQLEKLPLTPNGKIDRKALEKLEVNIKTEVEYEAPRNEKEERLVKIWSEVLELEKVGINHNFFEIGGNSINIIKIVTRIDKEFNIRFPIGELFITPTIKDLARKIDEETILNKLECIIKLNNSKSEKNIFAIHGVDGDAYYYKDLAKQLTEDCNFYAIGARGLIRETEAELPSTPEEMVNYYIEEIKQIQKEGPYIIVGYCAGSMLGYKMARILEDEGEKIEKLIMLDEHVFIPDFFIEILSEYGRIDDQILGELVAKYKEIAATDDTISKHINDFQEMLTRGSSLEIADDTSLTNKERVQNNLAHVVNKRYIPRRIINTPTYIIKSKENNHPRLTLEHWSRVVNNKIELFEITGDHESIFKYPDVRGLADIIKIIIKD